MSIVAPHINAAIVFNTDHRTVRAVFGTMCVPNLLGAAATRESMEYFLNAGFDEVDTSILYEKARTEATLGANVLSCSHFFILLDQHSTQVYFRWPSTAYTSLGAGSLSTLLLVKVASATRVQ